jgi:hypothetical protein
MRVDDSDAEMSSALYFDSHRAGSPFSLFSHYSQLDEDESSAPHLPSGYTQLASGSVASSVQREPFSYRSGNADTTSAAPDVDNSSQTTAHRLRSSNEILGKRWELEKQ